MAVSACDIFPDQWELPYPHRLLPLAQLALHGAHSACKQDVQSMYCTQASVSDLQAAKG